MPRGGRRQGAPGAAYGNRTDLNQSHTSITRIPGQEYGAQAAQVRAQQAVPVGPTPAPTTQGPLPSPGAVGPSPTGTQPIPLGAPTMRPNEPVTAGAPTGPGPGPEVLPPAPPPTDTTGGLIAALAQRSTSPELAALASFVNAGRG